MHKFKYVEKNGVSLNNNNTILHLTHNIPLHLPKNWMIFSCLSLATAKASLKNSILAFLSFNVLMATTMVSSFVSSKTVPLYTLPKAPLPTISNIY